MARKWGVSVGGPYGESVQLRMNATPISWLYNYNTQPDAYVFENWIHVSNHTNLSDWINRNGIEYVPMVASRSFLPLHGPVDAKGLCWLVTDRAPATFSNRVRCNSGQMSEALRVVQRRMNLPVRYLLTMNEPWFMDELMSPWEAVDIWRHYLQPMAKETGLRLVSPSVNVGHAEWMADFLQACYELRQQEPPCAVESIDAIAVHEYSCKESFWRDEYEREGFREAIIRSLDFRQDFWRAFLQGRHFWVTETNCNWENGDKSSDMPDGVETCERASGGRSSTHGRGSIALMNEIEEIDRWAWWTVSTRAKPGTRHYNARVADERGCLLGPGKALYAANAGQPVSCSSSSTTCPAAVDMRPPSPSRAAEPFTKSKVNASSSMIRSVPSGPPLSPPPLSPPTLVLSTLPSVPSASQLLPPSAELMQAPTQPPPLTEPVPASPQPVLASTHPTAAPALMSTATLPPGLASEASARWTPSPPEPEQHVHWVAQGILLAFLPFAAGLAIIVFLHRDHAAQHQSSHQEALAVSAAAPQPGEGQGKLPGKAKRMRRWSSGHEPVSTSDDVA